MRYYVTIGERTYEVDLTGPRPRVDGAAVDVDMAVVGGTATRHLLIDGRSVPFVARPGEVRGTWDLYLAGRRLAAEAVDERTRSIRNMTTRTAATNRPRPTRAPMPGLIVKVEVEAGQAVRAGQGVVIMEAMKMENELKAEVSGIVSQVLAQPGQAVEKGALLVEYGTPDGGRTPGGD